MHQRIATGKNSLYSTLPASIWYYKIRLIIKYTVKKVTVRSI